MNAADADMTFVSAAPEQTRAAGEALGRLLRGGDVVALSGPLGAGKTEFAKGLAAGLGVSADQPVVSPTFVLAREYAGRLRLYHLDAYRLSGASELLALGFEEMCADPAGVVAIEWADRAADAVPAHAIRVSLDHVDAARRSLHADAPGDREPEVRAALSSVLDRVRLCGEA
jgi:tRNA threonylcarbamoyladenosine biosynthesis protein TsaE